MAPTFNTLIYAAPRLDIDELIVVRKALANMLGKEFVIKSDNDESLSHKVIV